jgi:hypothetical protein
VNPLRDTDVVPALVAVALLLVWYVVLDLNLIAGIVLALLVYGIGRWVLVDGPRHRAKSTFADAQEQLRQLRQLSQNVTDPEVLRMVQVIDADVDRIIGFAFRRRQHIQTAQEVVDLYLQSTIDVLRRYQELQVNDVQSADSAMVEVRQVLPGIHQLLTKIWEDMHRADVVKLQTQTEQLRTLLAVGEANAPSAPSAPSAPGAPPPAQPPTGEVGPA